MIKTSYMICLKRKFILFLSHIVFFTILTFQLKFFFILSSNKWKNSDISFWIQKYQTDLTFNIFFTLCSKIKFSWFLRTFTWWIQKSSQSYRLAVVMEIQGHFIFSKVYVFSLGKFIFYVGICQLSKYINNLAEGGL